MGLYLRKKETGHAGGRAVLCWARWAGLGVGFIRAGRAGLGWAVGFGCAGRAGLGGAVGFGCAGRAGLGWARIWLFVYGLHCTCLLHVFIMSLCLSSCVSQMCYLI